MRWLGTIWALPWTALGLALAYVGGCRRAEGLEFVAPTRGPWRWFFARGWAAITLGEAIVYASAVDLATPWLRAHERRHVEQYRRIGLIFPLAYGLCSLLAVVMGREAHRDNWLELDATLEETEGGGDHAA